jgi:hypothetical protein
MSAVNTAEYKIDFRSIFGRANAPPSADSDFLDFRGLAAKLGTSEQWVRRNVRRTYTRDPIPHLRFGRWIRFVWDSQDMSEWIERHKATESATKSLSADARPASYNLKRTEHDETKRRKASIVGLNNLDISIRKETLGICAGESSCQSAMKSGR